MQKSLATFVALSAVLVFSSVASAGLISADAGDPLVPDLIYDSSTGEVSLDVDGAVGIIGYLLKNTTNSFLPGGHTPILGGVVTSLTSEISEASFSGPPGVNSIGVIFPIGLDLLGLTGLLSDNTVSRAFGSPNVPFDLVVINDAPAVPEPATIAMALMGLVGLGLYGWRRRCVC